MRSPLQAPDRAQNDPLHRRASRAPPTRCDLQDFRPAPLRAARSAARPPGRPLARGIAGAGPPPRPPARPRACSARAASQPRSPAVTTTARSPGRTANRATRSRAPPDSMIPGRSLLANTSGCSIAPVANDERARADLVQRRVLPDRHEPVEAAERARPAQHLHPGRLGLGHERGGAIVAALGEQAPTRLEALVGQHDVRAGARGGDRRAEPRGAAADDDHVGVAAPVLGAPLALGLLARQHAEARGAAQEALVVRPPAARPDERLVVEADRRERPAEEVARRA